MSTKARLDKLENPTKGAWCPHQPMSVVYGPDDSTPTNTPVKDALEPEPCWCGLPVVTLRVIYGAEKAAA